MPSPHLYVDSADVNRIRANLRAYPWYAEAYESIRAECETMISRGFSVPCESGYVFYNSCKRDNAILVFDPYDPENHVCPKCGMNYRDEPFQRAWNCSYHQWLAQMSLKLGICYLVGGNERYARGAQNAAGICGLLSELRKQRQRIGHDAHFSIHLHRIHLAFLYRGRL